jgi:cyclase
MRKISKAALLLVFCCTLLGAGFAQQGPVTLTVDKLTHNIYMVKGGVANTGFVVGKKEVIAIDAEMTTEMAQQMIAEIKKVTPLPITKVIVTHSDPDHVAGLSGFPKGVEVITSVNTKKELEGDFKSPKMQALLPYLPNKTYENKMELKLDGEKIQLLNFGPAHTSGDTIVFFPNQKVAFVGDVIFATGEPLFHDQPAKRGRADGMVNTAKQLLALNADRYISGHDAKIDIKGDLQAEIKRIEETKAKVQALIKEGKTRDDIKQAFAVKRYPNLPELIYLDLTEKK